MSRRYRNFRSLSSEKLETRTVFDVALGIVNGTISAQTSDDGGSIWVTEEQQELPGGVYDKNCIKVRVVDKFGGIARERVFLQTEYDPFGKGDVKLSLWGGRASDSVWIYLPTKSAAIDIHGGDSTDQFSMEGTPKVKSLEVFGDSGDDVISLHSITQAVSAPRIYGGFGNDTIYGSQIADLIFGGGDADVIKGGDGNDALFGEDGIDALFGGLGNDTLHGGGENDTLYGENGNDWLYGQLGNDALYGGDGMDTLYGDRDPIAAPVVVSLATTSKSDIKSVAPAGGNDYLDGGADAFVDQLYGDAGSDTFVEKHDAFGSNLSDSCVDFDANKDRKKAVDWS